MRTRRTIHQLAAFGLTVIVPWGIVAVLVATIWPEHLPTAILNGLGFISIVGVAAVNRKYYHRDVATLRDEVDAAIKASPVGQLLEQAGLPFRSAIPDKQVTSVPIPGDDAIAGIQDGGVINMDAARDAIRNSHP